MRFISVVQMLFQQFVVEIDVEVILEHGRRVIVVLLLELLSPTAARKE